MYMHMHMRMYMYTWRRRLDLWRGTVGTWYRVQGTGWTLGGGLRDALIDGIHLISR